MITKRNDCYFLSTRGTTLLLRVNELGKLVNEYYGPRIEPRDPAILCSAFGMTGGRTVVYDKEKSPKASLNDINSEYSTPYKGDQRSPMICLKSEDGVVFDFVVDHEEIGEPKHQEGYPNPHDASEEIIFYCVDPLMKMGLELHYVVYEDSDVIGKYIVLENQGEKNVTIFRALSSQLVLKGNYVLKANYGNWAGEFQDVETKVNHFRYSFDSNSGASGDYHNPFFLLYEEGAGHHHGNAYGFNLIYSGNHYAEVEQDSYGRIRILQGISPMLFEQPLGNQERFVTPMAVLTFSNEGLNGIAHHMHDFVNKHVVPKKFAYVPRPICFNNWEGTGMKFDEGKLKSLAKKASDLGCELFVLDDGWFGQRNDDTSSLGDYDVNKKKLPHGIHGISEYVRKKGMKFGLWFEPEMISVNSKLYESHPEFAISDGIHKPSEGRNQLTLDLTKPEVIEYICENLKEFLSSGDIDFVKWDNNRTFSDLPSTPNYAHRYILGLYSLLERLTKEFPDILFENCASGGGRNDLGMFSYFPQGWVSDDTDSFERAKMQLEMAYGYPLSVLSNHVAAKTSNQMLRKTSFGTKFDIACFGILGYEMDINDLDPLDEKEIKAEIEYYKAHRETLQYGRYDVLDTLEHNRQVVQVSSDKEIIVSYMNGLQTPNLSEETIAVVNAKPEARYHFCARKESINLHRFGTLLNYVVPIHIKEDGKIVNFLSRFKGMDTETFEGTTYGDMLLGGFKLAKQWAGTGMDETTRILLDFGARLYTFTEEDENE